MRKICIFFSFLVSGYAALAQAEFGVFGGIANYQGDMVDKAYQSARGAFGLSLGYELSKRITVRGGLTFAKVAGADSLSNHSDLRARNLSFQSAITELSLRAEVATFDLDYKKWTPYVFAGLAVYHFNPYTYDQRGNRVYLQGLSTEGEGLPQYPNVRPYALTQIALPFGGGIKFSLSDNVRLGLEVGLRKLFTDYLDDVSGTYADPNDLLAARGPRAVELSYRGGEVRGGDPNYPSKGMQRGSPKSKDYYYFTGIQVQFLLPEGNHGSVADKAARKAGYGCPVLRY